MLNVPPDHNRAWAIVPPTPVMRRPLVRLAIAWVTGTAAGITWPVRSVWLWLALVCTSTAIVWALRRRDRAARTWGLLSAVVVAGLWSAVRTDGVAHDDVRLLLGDEARLCRVEGRVASPVRLTPSSTGYFARFDYRAPMSLFEYELTGLHTPHGLQPLQGRVLVRVDEADTRLEEGDHVEIIGWLGAFDGPSNPGELDFSRLMRSRRIDARLTSHTRGTVRRLDHADAADLPGAIRRWIGDVSRRSLISGLDGDTVRMAMLDALVLGRWSQSLQEVGEAFRRTGLVHLLCVSGAHLSLLAALVWALLRLAMVGPTRAAFVVMAVLGLYMLVVPMEVPVVRAGIMAGLIVMGIASGRDVRAIDMLALSAILVLIWRPEDIFDAGTQLSFTGVAALLLFTTPISRWLLPPPILPTAKEAARHRRLRWVADFVAANLVGAAVSLPLVATHFGMVSPLSFVLSMLGVPLIGLLLSLGFIKLAVGLVFPTLGILLAWPVMWVSDLSLVMIGWMSRLPAVAVELEPRPSPVWCVAALLFIAAVVMGRFSRRRSAAVACVVLLLSWAVVPTLEGVRAKASAGSSDAVMTLYTIAVGDGSCYLARLDPHGHHGGPFHILFDCGSQQYFEVGKRSVLPALRALGVGRIDTMVISHADMDHFVGMLDVADALPIGRVLTTRHVLAAARERPESATGFLIEELRKRGLPIEDVARGWRESHAGTECEIIWPAADFEPRKSNDTSIVMSLRVAGRRVMLTGDIQQEAMTRMFAMRDDLRADIVDLPHHGSFVEASPAWIRAASPQIVLQSSGVYRRPFDRWAPVLSDLAIQRLMTDRDGMITVWINAEGLIGATTFKNAQMQRRY